MRVEARPACLPGLAFVLAAIAAAALPLRAQIRPNAAYRVVESAHYRVTYGPRLEPLARRALDTAERTHALLESSVTQAPDGMIDIVLVDDLDFSNGFASPFPSNRIVVYARPPFDDEALSYSTDWIDLVVSHEVTHIFHLDRAGAVGRVLRSLFGRMPLLFPMFPVVGTPAWSTEGLAVDVESAYTGLGRLHGSNHEMIVRTGALEGLMDRMDRLNESSPIWPGGQRVYIYGSLFMEYLAERYGEDVHGRLLDGTASAILPPFLFFDGVARRTFDESFDEAYAAWRSELERKYAILADSLRAEGLTTSERVTEHGRWAIHARVSPDGRRLAYTAEDGKAVTSLRIIELESGRGLASHRRNGLGSHAWTPDGGLVFAQYEHAGTYRILNDLWLEGAAGHRITKGQRIQDPDVRGDGRIVAVRNGEGGAGLVLVDPGTGDTEQITAHDPAVLWAFPRWSPDGTRIAASRWSAGGEHAIVILDEAGAELMTVFSGPELNVSPAWSPDGRYLMFSSDRTGIANLYAADLRDPSGTRVRRVTNVLTGAFFPEISPDGGSIYFSRYHADGYAIERMPFDPSTWLQPAPARPSAAAERDGDASVADSVSVPSQAASRSYSPWRFVAPTFWSPLLTSATDAGTFVGASLRGEDLVRRHAFRAGIALDLEGSGLWEGFLRYDNARLGNPIISMEASRFWDDLGMALLPDTTEALRLERGDRLALLASFLYRRWRTSATLSVGIEREVFKQRLIGTQQFRLRDPEDAYLNLLLRFSIANTQRPQLAVSREDGITFAMTATRAFEDESTVYGDSTGTFPEDYNEFRAVAGVYRSLDLGGFAHHVLALRASGFRSTGHGASFQSVGGSTGGYTELLGFGIASGSRLTPVRGFDAGTLRGTRAWSATAEWRAPLALVGRRPTISPFFIDRISAAAFLDAGDAWCTAEEQAISETCRRTEAVTTPIVGAGAELIFDVGFAGIFTGRIRTGAGVPIRGPARDPSVYVQIGSNF